MKVLEVENIGEIPIEWNELKNDWLKRERGISFKMVANLIRQNEYIGIIDNPNYKNQKMLIILIENYINCVPFVYDGSKIFLKTIYQSRKYNKIYNVKRSL